MCVLTLADAAEHSFTGLKDRLVELLTPSILEKCTGILWGQSWVVGGLQSYSDEPAGHIFTTIFLHRLPGDLKDLVAVQFHQLGVMELTRYADVIWDARNSKKKVVAAMQPATVEEETTHGVGGGSGQVAALTIHVKKK